MLFILPYLMTIVTTAISITNYFWNVNSFSVVRETGSVHSSCFLVEEKKLYTNSCSDNFLRITKYEMIAGPVELQTLKNLKGYHI